MLLNLLFIVIGIALVVWGASLLTDGAVALAVRMGVPQIVIGLTIVAIGTSMPEFFVSLTSAIKGNSDMAVGNIVGSNIFNALLIVGLAAIVSPMVILRSTVKKDIPFALFASVLLLLLCLDSSISRIDAALLLAVFALFMYVTLKNSGKDSSEEPSGKVLSPLKAGLYVAIGLACLIFGSDLFVNNASEMARTLGVSEAVIGLTIVAGGTSMPELATSVVAARKGNSGIAIGNVLGSNVLNILFILGFTGIVRPIAMAGITMVDLAMLIVSMVLLWLFSFTKYTIARWEGILLTLVFVGYLSYLLVNAV